MPPGAPDEFDPYHKWLGIPKQFRPPTHYQLLGLAIGEDDPDVIEEAAMRQSAHLRRHQTGPRADRCTQLLSEINRARQVLLDPEKRAAYDGALARQNLPAPATSALLKGWLIGSAIGGVILLGAVLSVIAIQSPAKIDLPTALEITPAKIETAVDRPKQKAPKAVVPDAEVAKIDPPKKTEKPAAKSPLDVELSVGEARRFSGHVGAVTALFVPPDGKRFYSGGVDGAVRSWDLATGQQLSTFNAGTGVAHLELSPDQRFVSIYDRARVTLRTAEDPANAFFHMNSLCVPCWTDDNRLVFAWMKTGSYIYTANTRAKTTSSLPPKASKIKSVPPRSTCFIVNNEIYLLDRANDKFPRPIKLTPQAPLAAVLPGHNALVLGSADKTLRKYSLPEDRFDGSYAGLDSAPRCIAVSSLRTHIAAGGDGKTVVVWNAETGKIAAQFDTTATMALAFLPDDRHLLSASGDGTIHLWNLPPEIGAE